MGVIYRGAAGASTPFTLEEYFEIYPQFKTVVPEETAKMYLDFANSCIKKSVWRGGWKAGIGLFVSHFLRCICSPKQRQTAPRQLKRREAVVGIPRENAGRKDGINNAELLYIHTNGSPVNNIPPRPVIEPAIEDAKYEIARLIKGAADQALNRNLDGALAQLDKAGQYGENAAKGWFRNPKNHWTENSSVTVGRKGSARPLIDTDNMRKSITHVVKEK